MKHRAKKSIASDRVELQKTGGGASCRRLTMWTTKCCNCWAIGLFHWQMHSTATLPVIIYIMSYRKPCRDLCQHWGERLIAVVWRCRSLHHRQLQLLLLLPAPVDPEIVSGPTVDALVQPVHCALLTTTLLLRRLRTIRRSWPWNASSMRCMWQNTPGVWSCSNWRSCSCDRWKSDLLLHPTHPNLLFYCVAKAKTRL